MYFYATEKQMKQNKQTNNTRTIEVGKFYYLHDGSKTGHPCYVIWKNDERNRYLVVRFDSDKHGETPKTLKGVRHITKLSKPTSTKVTTSYIRNRPMLCKRKDIGGEMNDLHLSDYDKNIVHRIGRNKFERSPSLKK